MENGEWRMERGGMEDELAGVPTLEEIERHPMDDWLRAGYGAELLHQRADAVGA
jgi:hypothetical protein